MDFIKLAPGPLMATGRDLDILMNDQTVLGVQAPNGELAFTRRGDLQSMSTACCKPATAILVLGDNQSRLPFLPVSRSRLPKTAASLSTTPTSQVFSPRPKLASFCCVTPAKPP